MGYSKISTIELINFMSFKKAKVSFDETNILNIKGYNDSGKSTILRAVAVCLMDMFKSKQVKFIRHGEEYFRIVVTFDDGVAIVRDKYINGQSLYEVYNKDKLVYTSKQGNRLARIEGVPKQVQDYLGLCVTDSVYLNYQSCVDRLPVVDTTGSENYQMFHEVLRMEEIYRANHMINLDKNELGAEISQIEAELHNSQVLLDKCGDIDEELIRHIELLDKKATESNNKKLRLEKVQENMVNLWGIKKLPNIERVSVDRLEKVLGIRKITDVLDKRVIIPKIDRVSTDRLSRLTNITSMANTLENRKSLPKIEKVSLDRMAHIQGIKIIVDKMNSMETIPFIPRIDSSLIDKRVKLGMIAKNYTMVKKEEIRRNEIVQELEHSKSLLKEIAHKAEVMGINLVKCNNCGTYTVAGGGHSHE